MRSVLLFLLGWSAIAPAANGPAKFFARRDYGPGADLVRVADVNGDGIPDLVEINGYSNTITTLLGNGDGTFRAGPTSKPGLLIQLGRSGLAAMDLNGDGKIDLVIAGSANGMGGIGVCFGNGNGTFQPAIFYPASSDQNMDDLVLGDFNGDGILDAVSTGLNSGLWLFEGKGGGVFSPGVLTPIPTQGTVAAGGRLAAADFNGDGYLDLAVTVGFPSGFMVLLGNGNGTFQKPITVYVPLFESEYYIAVGDLNQDGYPDIVLSPTHASVSYVDVFLNNGKGGFSKHSQVNMNGAVEIAVGDVNGDGIPT